ncbi:MULTISPECIES: hypothetical protein [Streptomyces]|uniref:Uncharacterized protein n=2 Tax=Streptomyces TaxID=1883 RepID=A0ABV9J5T2_9ACTN
MALDRNCRDQGRGGPRPELPGPGDGQDRGRGVRHRAVDDAGAGVPGADGGGQQRDGLAQPDAGEELGETAAPARLLDVLVHSAGAQAQVGQGESDPAGGRPAARAAIRGSVISVSASRPARSYGSWTRETSASPRRSRGGVPLQDRVTLREPAPASAAGS